jgi:hypothetical protein
MSFELHEHTFSNGIDFPCVVCCARGAELLATCPGSTLNREAHRACANGNVYDFVHLRTIKLRNPERFAVVLKREQLRRKA